MAATCGWTFGGPALTNRIRALAQELVGLQPDIMLTNGAAATVALQRETRTIPIVFAGAEASPKRVVAICTISF